MDEYRRNQNFWHFISTIVYAGLVALSMYIIIRVHGTLPSRIPGFDLLLIAFAVFRLIRLFTYDMVMSFVRDFFGQFKTGPGRTVYNLLDCPWCTGVWMSLIVVFFYFLTSYAWYVIFLLALAGMGTYLQIIIWKIGLEKLEDDEQMIKPRSQ